MALQRSQREVAGDPAEHRILAVTVASLAVASSTVAAIIALGIHRVAGDVADMAFDRLHWFRDAAQHPARPAPWPP